MAVIVDKESFDIGKDGRVVLRIQWLADNRSEAIRDIPMVQENLVRTSLSASPWISRDHGKYLVNATYEGLVEEQQAEEAEQYELSSEYREAKIETFPDREVLRNDYGAVEEDGRLVFPPTIKTPTSGGSGLGNKKSAEVPNPFYNLTTYPVEYAVANWTILRKRVPSELERQVGTVIGSLPSGFDYNGNAKSWLVRPLRRRKVGNMWEINVQYQQVDEFSDVEALLILLQKAKKQNKGVGSGLGSSFGTFRFTSGVT